MDRDRLLDTYRATRCFLLADGAWQAFAVMPSEATGLIITAWNPAGRRLPPATNAARDEALQRELRARELAPVRARGAAADGSWHEDGWLVAHEHHRSLELIARWGQLAGYVVDVHGRRVLWADGREDALDAERGR